MKKNQGFTLLEIAIITVILGIIGAFAIIQFKKTIANTTLEKASNNLYTELSGLRSVSFKNDEIVMVTFSNASEQCKIYIDENGDSLIQEDELYKTHDLPSPVTIGISDPQPASWIFDYEPENGLADNWKTTFFVAPDSRQLYSSGGIYLTIPNLPKVTYFIGVTSGIQSIKFYKWNGSSWIEL